jgi:hypothetical protein
MNENDLTKDEYLLLKCLVLQGGSAPVYYLDRYTIEKIVNERKTPEDISREIDEDPNAPDVIYFGSIMADSINKLMRRGYILTESPGLYVGLTREGLEALKKHGEEKLWEQLKDKV